VMALSVIKNTNEPHLYLYCPMIDARRMEVFTAIYNDELREIKAPRALVLEPTYFDEIMKDRQIIFSGNGAEKFLKLSFHQNLRFSSEPVSALALAEISLKKFKQKKFADLSNTEPVYMKQFYTI